MRWNDGAVKSIDHSGIEVIDADECMALLEGRQVGRIAITVGSQPLIFPVNYGVLDGTIVFRSAPGTKVDAGPGSPACFQVDDFDVAMRSGWSVLVVGRLEAVGDDDAAERARLADAGVTPWAGGERNHWLRLHPRQVTGRRVG